jgi:hypothetical protein
MIKFYKWGFGRVSDYCNEEIRLGRIPREEAIKLVDKYDGTIGKKYVESFCKYINITEEKFWENIRSLVNKKLFYIDNNLNIKKKFKVGQGLLND